MAGYTREQLKAKRAELDADQLRQRRAAAQRIGEPQQVARPDQAPQPPARESRADGVRQERRRRRDVSAHGDLNLSIPDHLANDKRYRYHWFLDKPGRIQRNTVDDDWDLVTDEEIAGDSRQRGAGTLSERHGGADKHGNPQRHFLARKLREYDDEDKRRGQAKIDEKMKQIKRGKPTDDNGEPTHGDGSYVPQGRTVIQENYNPS